MHSLKVFVFLLMIAPSITYSQISGSVQDDQGKPLSGASLALKNAADSAVVKLAVSHSGGLYTFSGVSAGTYYINVTFIGYTSSAATVHFAFSGSPIKAPIIVLKKASADLKEVTVTATRPIIEVKADRMIMNVEGSINAVGQDAFELLRKAPGVLADRDDNLSLSGKNGVQVYIDGKPTPLSGKDLASYLHSIQSSSIEAIEIITNPSAKYDAAGNAGIINIRLKKNKSFGTNGSVNAGYGVGIFPKYNAGIALNNRSAKVNIFGNYNYGWRKNESFIRFDRQQLDSLFNQSGSAESEDWSHNVKAGLDYFINDKHTIGFMMNGNYSSGSSTNTGNTEISYKPTAELIKTLVASNNIASTRDQTNVNLNYRFADTSGKSLNLDADYGIFRIRTNQLQPNFYFDPSGTPLDSRIYNMISPTDINISTVKADYEQNYKQGRLSAGAKVAYVKSLNHFKRFDILGGEPELDRERSNDFDYTENINAAYVSYNRPIKKFTIQFGIRAEQTVAKGESHGQKWNGTEYIGYDSIFNRDYLNLFPSGAISFTKNPNNQFNLTFSRRIDRPSYQDLNPFEFKMDEYTYNKGNTQLRPQYTNNIGISHTYKYKLTTSLNYSHINDVFTQLIDTAERSKIFITRKNLATQDIASININYPLQIRWYSAYANLNTYYSHYKANFGEGRSIDLDVFAYNIYTQHSAKLGKGITAELTLWYTSPSIWQGTFKSKPMWAMDAGLQKIILKGKGNIKAAVSDIFQTMRWGGYSNFAGQYVRASGGFESRQFKLNFSYRFGNMQVKSARQRKAGLEDENQRVSSGNGGGGLSK
jgi:iron complex outermembrane receptor protein